MTQTYTAVAHLDHAFLVEPAYDRRERGFVVVREPRRELALQVQQRDALARLEFAQTVDDASAREAHGSFESEALLGRARARMARRQLG